MFTGLIESVGTIRAIAGRGDYTILTIESMIPSTEIIVGESISCDGACLTVAAVEASGFVVEASRETAARTILHTYQTDSKINLERALRVGDRLGGHFVTGHIDCTGAVDYARRVGESLELAIKYDAAHDKLVIEKGSIAINGVSLTVNLCRSGWFTVNIIPYTAMQTTLETLLPGAAVNLEFDLIGKYILTMHEAGSKSSLTIDTILKSGW
jgi:riboflavin synthase